MGKVMYTFDEVRNRIAQGKKLLLAGDESLLRKLPPGDWVAGTIPYFMAEEGSLCTRDKIYVIELPAFALDVEIKAYDEETIPKVNADAPGNGFSVIIIPAKCNTHYSFALNAPSYEGFAQNPLIGWVSGVHLDDLDKITPKVFNGVTTEALEEGAVVMHVTLPRDKVADIGIINIFEQGEGDDISFLADGFSAKEAYINGKKRNFAEYVSEKRLDKRLPLVADYYGAMINTSFQEGEEPEEEVRFYAPVFSGVRYRHAKPVKDPIGRFAAMEPAGIGDRVLLSCNCILNYLYVGSGGTTEITGPTTFGEIAYQLLNQTLVYLRIIDLPYER